MPRLLPRLIEKLNSQMNKEKWRPSPLLNPKKNPSSLHKPVPARPSFNYASYPRSILLAPQNPVVHAKEYVRHKTLPPTICRFKPSDTLNAPALDKPRQMNGAEFGWWANPYLRMMASPSRRCSSTMRHLPSDLLVRLTGVRTTASVLRRNASSHPMTVLVPDGLLHSKYQLRRRTGGGVYVFCWRQTVQQLVRRGAQSVVCPGAVVHPRTEEYIAHLLRLRVVQEFELLAERLEYAMYSGKNSGTPDTILRKLTRDEWQLLKTSGTVPFPDAVAILVVPSVNKDTTTKQRPKANMSALPPDDHVALKTLPPVSTLLPVSLDNHSVDPPDRIPLLKIPLYNGISAFPSRSQRGALHSVLQRILRAERSHKRLHSHSQPRTSTDSKASHAYALFSNGQTAKRGDPASIARALWRLRMYEGEGWTDNEYIVQTS